MKILVRIFLMLLFICINAYPYHNGMHKKKPSIAQLAVSTPKLSTLVVALKRAHLVGALKGRGPFTVFAPTNHAFKKLPKGMLNKLLANPKKLKRILLYHVVPRKIPSWKIKRGHVKTLQGQSLRTRRYHGSIFVNRAKVVTADIMARNGVIHMINSVLIPH